MKRYKFAWITYLVTTKLKFRHYLILSLFRRMNKTKNNISVTFFLSSIQFFILNYSNDFNNIDDCWICLSTKIPADKHNWPHMLETLIANLSIDNEPYYTITIDRVERTRCTMYILIMNDWSMVAFYMLVV